MNSEVKAASKYFRKKNSKTGSEKILFLTVSVLVGVVLSLGIYNRPSTIIIGTVIITAFMSFALNAGMIYFCKGSVAFSMIYSIIMLSGMTYTRTGTLKPSMSVGSIALFVIQSLSFFILFMSVYGVLTILIRRISISDDSTSFSYGKKKANRSKKLIVLATSIIVYSTWLYLLRPNIATYDSANQINQAFGWIPLSNNNPFMHTLMIRCIVKSAFCITKSVTSAIAVYSFVSVCFVATITTVAILFIDKHLPDNKPARIILKGYYYVNPLIGWYAITLWKDIWISYFVMLLIIVLTGFLNKDDMKHGYHFFHLFFIALAVLFSKGTGILYIGVLLIMVIFEPNDRLKGKKVLLIALVASIITYEVSVVIAYNIYNIERHPSADTESVIWQTLGRTAKYHENDLTKEDRRELEQFIDIDKASQLYDSRISDPIKGNCLNYNYFQDNRAKCIRIWLNIGSKYPLTYLNAIYGAGYGYLYPETKYWVFASSNYITTVQNEMYQPYLKDPFASTYDVGKAYTRERDVNKIKDRLDSIREYPFVGLYASIGAGFMIYIFLIIMGIDKNLYNRRILAAVPVAVLIGCVLSPVYAEMRYAYPAVLSLPVYIVAYSLQRSQK